MENVFGIGLLIEKLEDGEAWNGEDYCRRVKRFVSFFQSDSERLDRKVALFSFI